MDKYNNPINLKCEEILDMTEKILGDTKTMIFVKIIYRGIGWEHGWELHHEHNQLCEVKNDDDDFWYLGGTLEELHQNVAKKLAEIQK